MIADAERHAKQVTKSGARVVLWRNVSRVSDGGGGARNGGFEG
jgi:hypothetical protein